METRGRKKAATEPAPPARDPHDVETIKRLQQRIQELEGRQSFWRRKPFVDKGNRIRTYLGYRDEEEKYPFVNKHLCFQEEPIMLVEEDSCHVYDTDNKEEESMSVYDTDIEDVIKEEEGFVRIEESSERSFKDDSLLDVANLARDIYPGSFDNISKQKGQEEHVKTLSQQLNNVPIDNDSVASSHNRIHRRHGSLNRGKRQKFKGRGRVPRAAKNEMSMAFNFVDEGASHSKQHIEDYGDGSQDSAENRSAWLHNYSGELVQALSNAIAKKKVGLLYVFYGPHGTGKTSCARIIAWALTYQSLDHSKPYGYCNSCVAHDTGKNWSVREVGPLNNLGYKGIMQPSQYRLFITDDCGTLPPEWWSAISKVIDQAPRRMSGKVIESGSHNELMQTDDSYYFKMVQLQLSAPSIEIQSPHRRFVSASPTSVVSSTPNTPLMNLFSQGFSMSSPYSVQVDALFESDYEDNSKKLSHPKPSQFRLMKMNSPKWVTALWGCLDVGVETNCDSPSIKTLPDDNPSVNPVDVCKPKPRMNWKIFNDISDLISGKNGELVSLFSVESTIKTELDQNIHALATTLEDGKSCAGKDTPRVQITLSDMRSLSNMFAASRQKAKISDFMERMEMAELKVVQTVVLESTTTTQVEGTGDKKNQDEEAKDKKKGKGTNSKESDDEENSRTRFSQAGEDDAGTLDRNVLVEYLKF
nr:protein STICHEL-like 3 [Tanacetum cinerariifolium]